MDKAWFQLCREGSVDDILAHIRDVQIPKWLGYYENKRAKDRARKRRKAESEDTELVEVPWLKKARVQQDELQKAPEGHEDTPAAPIGPIIPPEVLERKGSKALDPGPLLQTCVHEDCEAQKMLQRRLKSFVNAPDAFGRTPLHLAAFGGNIGAMKLLLEKHQGECMADIRALAKDNMQPIHFAASAGKTEAVKLCLRFGARVNAKTGKGSKTPLALAEQKGHTETIEFLKQKGGQIVDEGANDEEFQAFLKTGVLGVVGGGPESSGTPPEQQADGEEGPPEGAVKIAETVAKEGFADDSAVGASEDPPK